MDILAPRARDSARFWCRGAARLPPTRGTCFGSQMCCMGSVPAHETERQPWAGLAGSLARTASAAGLCPEPGHQRQPELSPSLLGLVARSAASVNRACCFTVGLSRFSPPAPLRDVFPVQRTPWDPVSPAVPSPTWSQHSPVGQALPAMGTPQWAPPSGHPPMGSSGGCGGLWCEPGGRMKLEGSGNTG